MRTDWDTDEMLIPDGPLPLRGVLIWLTRDQGGRASGPPATPAPDVYAATAYVPPATGRTGLASFVLAADDRTRFRTHAAADWLVAPPAGAVVIPGTVVVITEGARDVAYFHVESVSREAHLSGDALPVR